MTHTNERIEDEYFVCSYSIQIDHSDRLSLSNAVTARQCLGIRPR